MASTSKENFLSKQSNSLRLDDCKSKDQPSLTLANDCVSYGCPPSQRSGSKEADMRIVGCDFVHLENFQRLREIVRANLAERKSLTVR